MRVLFIHPCHPNQFTRIAHELGARPGWECLMLVGDGNATALQQTPPPIAYYGYSDPQAAQNTGPYYLQSLEEGARRGKAVVDVVAYLHARAPLDVVIGHASFGTTFFIREVLGIPVVSYVELPGYHALKARPEFPVQAPHAYLDVTLRALIYSSALHSDRVIVPSQHAQQLFPPELQAKVRVQMEGFDITPRHPDPASLRRDLNLPHAGPIIGYAARTLEAVRGFDLYVAAAQRIRAQRPDVHFLVVGDESTLYGNETAYLNGQTFKHYALAQAGMAESDFIFRPYMAYPSFMQHLQAMDIMLCPLFEGAANWGLFEALAAGVPVIASDRCFIPEVIRHGRNGYTLPNDPAHYATATLELLDNPRLRTRLARAAQNTIQQHYTISHAADGYAAILREVMQPAIDLPPEKRK